MFLVNKQFKFHDLDLSPYILKLRIISFFSKKVFLMVIVNFKVYKRTYSKRDHVIMCEYLYYMYIYISMYDRMYMCMYTCTCMS